MFRKILIANRGEIALRILRACRTLGIEAVVAYSEADRESLPVQLADEAICIGPADARRSYLSAPAVISAAIVTGCDAIHPGYGFLSEDDAFAEVVRAHDLTFIGPPAPVLERFASKEATRRLLGSLGLPTIPGSNGILRDDAHALEEGERVGYPLLIKPAAGGGGKGMRMVRTPRELEASLNVCRSEARSAFGDDSLYLERWLDETRHVEVQVAVDRYGRGIHLGERDCSVQRRHQKILEEGPTPALSPEARNDLCTRAVRAHLLAGYEVPPFYDSLLGKLIVWAPNRQAAIERSQVALGELIVDGLVTNVPIHQALLASEAFLEGRMTTNLLDRVGSSAFLAAAARS